MPGEIELIVSRQALTHRFLVRVGAVYEFVFLQ